MVQVFAVFAYAPNSLADGKFKGFVKANSLREARMKALEINPSFEVNGEPLRWPKKEKL